MNFSIVSSGQSFIYCIKNFNVTVGNSTDYNEFTVISDGAYIEAPTEWTTYEFDLSRVKT